MSPEFRNSGHRTVAVKEKTSVCSSANTEIVEAQLSPPTVSEALAMSVVTTSADDSLAIDQSILAHAKTRELDHRPWLYVFTWPIMMVVAAMYAVMIFTYRLACIVRLVKGPTGEKPEERKIRLLLGPKRLNWAFLGHELALAVRHGVTTSGALDVIYAASSRKFRKIRSLSDFMLWYWLKQPDGQAVSNRLRITYQAARSELERLIATGQTEIHFLVLACGSAQASIEAVAHVQAEHPEVDIRLTLVDLNFSSLRRAFRFGESRNTAHRVQIIAGYLNEFLEDHTGSWDIVEMVGFLDYRSPASFHRTCEAVHAAVKPEGLFIAAGICPSWWSFVVRWVINWPALIRRKPAVIESMLAKAGFTRREAKPEPHGIHHVVLCRK